MQQHKAIGRSLKAPPAWGRRKTSGYVDVSTAAKVLGITPCQCYRLLKTGLLSGKPKVKMEVSAASLRQEWQRRKLSS